MGLGDIVGSVADSIINNSRNRRDAERDRSFQERMSGSSYQRAMTDMKSAGLNPMLAYKLGGASTPSGSQTVASESGLQAAAGNARAAKLLTEQLNATKASANASNASAELSRSQIPKNNAEGTMYQVLEQHIKSGKKSINDFLNWFKPDTSAPDPNKAGGVDFPSRRHFRNYRGPSGN